MSSQRIVLLGTLTFLLSFSLFVYSASGAEKKPEKLKLCHFPPGNSLALHTIKVDSSAVKSHLRHGDKKGGCGVSKKKINQLKTHVLRNLPRNPNNINFSSESVTEVYEALRDIAEYELGRSPAIQQLLVDWSAYSFSSPPLFNITDLYLDAVVTMPDRKLFYVLIETEPNRFTNTSERLATRDINFNQMAKAISRQFESNRKVSPTKNGKGGEQNSSTATLSADKLQILEGLDRLTPKLSNTRKNNLRKALNENIKNPVSLFWPDEAGSAVSIKNFVEVINELNWHQLEDFLKDIVKGKFDEQIKSFRLGEFYLKEIKSTAEQTLNEFQ